MDWTLKLAQPPTGTGKRRRRGRRRLLCFDLLAETVGWWSLEAVRRLTGGANSWSLLRTCRYNRAYKQAQKPHRAGNLWLDGEGVRICGRTVLPVLPADVPPLLSLPIITGFHNISIDYRYCNLPWGLISFAEKAAPLLGKGTRRLVIGKPNRRGTTDGIRWFCDHFDPALRRGGFRPRSVRLFYFEAQEIGALLRQPLIRDCPAVEIFSSSSLTSDAVVGWLHRPSAKERIMLLTSTYYTQSWLAPLKSAFASTRAPGDARPYVMIWHLSSVDYKTPFRLKNRGSGEGLVLERLTRDHFRAEDLLQSSFWAQVMCNSNDYWVLRRGCLVGPQLPLKWSPFDDGHLIGLTV